MKKSYLLSAALGMLVAMPVSAQRFQDKLDRGLVAVKKTTGVLCSWRIQADEYYDVKYNIYRDGTKLNDTPLDASNYNDISGTTDNSYTVEAIVRGKSQGQSAAVKPFGSNYLEVKMDHGDLTSTYVPNDACCADVDGDGEVEILLKFDNSNDDGSANGNNGEYEIIEVYKLNGKKLWWIACGPNIGDFQNNELNIVGYDWDMDGKAECVLRLADGSVIHKADGSTITIGNASTNVRPSGAQSGQWFIHDGAEYLVYLNGETGEVYDQMTYPLKRLESGETDLEAAWGDGYGHRATKHFFGAPYLDGKKPSIFLARGIYTRHKMIALDVDASSHKLSTRWTWNCNSSGSSWYGQGYHNYSIADVDMDGRDEIVFGSMVIDDNGKGLSTSGLGHGDSHHVGDFDPYTWGLEVFACNESQPGNNFRDATTSKIYYRYRSGDDDGRAIAGNFYDQYPGAQMVSAKDGNLIGGASHAAISGGSKNNIAQNFRIYWDGDLCDETFNYTNGKNTAGGIYKAGSGLIATLEGSMTNNDTKGTPCYQGDIFGDWREEVIMRTADNNIRIYTTNIPTTYRNYSLWYDHQYRNAMVWQMCGYNQTPHVSYFLGKLEGITMAPPPLTTTGRTVLAAGSTVGSEHADKHVLFDEQADATLAVADGASPYIFTDNAPSWTQGSDNNNNIKTVKYTHTLTGGAFAGEMRLVKQGEGTLVLPNVTETYSGNTDVWNGTLQFDGTLKNSHLWLNRHTTLVTTGGTFSKGIKADYNSNIIIGGTTTKSTLTTDSLELGFGATVNFKIYDDGTSDQLTANVITLETKTWSNGPAYNAPMVNITAENNTAKPGTYIIGKVGAITGDLSAVTIKGISGSKATLEYENGELRLVVHDVRDAAAVEWTGAEDQTWDLANKTNFKDAEGTADIFVAGDDVTFNDNATNFTVNISGNPSPKSITIDNTTKYTFDGDSIIGEPTLTKKGTGEAIINNVNRLGNTTISGGKLTVASLANSAGVDYGSLGDVKKSITITEGGTLKASAAMTIGQPIYISGEGTIECGAAVTMARGIQGGGTLTKKGTSTLSLVSGNNLKKLVIANGTVAPAANAQPSSIEFGNGSTLEDNGGSSFNSNNATMNVPANVTATLNMGPWTSYSGKLTGTGTLNVIATGIRCPVTGNWSDFEGTIKVSMKQRGSYAPGGWMLISSKGLPKATLNIPSGVTVTNTYSTSSSTTTKDVILGKVTGSGTLAGNGKWILGDNDESFTFGLTSTATLLKRGTGTMRILTPGKLSCQLYVTDGILTWSESKLATALLGTKMLYVQEAGKVVANGLVQSITMSGNSQLTPTTSVYSLDKPESQAAGTFATTSIFTANGNATVNFRLTGNGSSSKLRVGTDLKLSKINVTLKDGYTPAAGDEFTLWTCKNMLQAPTSIVLPDLPSGLSWDTTALTDGSTTGTLKVVADMTGIDGVEADANGKSSIYSLDGKKMNNTRKAGVYIINGKKVVIK